MLACLTHAPTTKQGKSSGKTIAFFSDDSVEKTMAPGNIVIHLLRAVHNLLHETCPSVATDKGIHEVQRSVYLIKDFLGHSLFAPCFEENLQQKGNENQLTSNLWFIEQKLIDMLTIETTIQ
jgi:hypothetical protein